MKEKKNEGITLIALVITIIVLLILAGVTLSTLFGNNGILTESKLAVESNKEANAREQVQLAWTACETEYQAALTKDSTKTRGDYFNNTNLNKNLGTGNLNLKQFEENGKSIVEYVDQSNTKYTYEIVNGQVYSDGTAPEVVDPGSIAGPLKDKVEAKNYGDFINYNVDLNGNGNVTDDWKIFYNDGENVFIIASECLPENKIPSISTMTKRENRITWNDNVESYRGAIDIDKGTAKKFGLNWLFVENHENLKYTGIKCIQDLMDTNKWNDFATGVSGAEAIGSPTLEMWINSWNAKYPEEPLIFNKGENTNSDGSVYQYDGPNWYDVPRGAGYVVGGKLYKENGESFWSYLTGLLCFSQNEYSNNNYENYWEVDLNYPKGSADSLFWVGSQYWISSPGQAAYCSFNSDLQDYEDWDIECPYHIEDGNQFYQFQKGICDCIGSNYSVMNGLRPVVWLPSTVNATKSGSTWIIEK